jgi:hypothetical protein
MPKPRPMHPNEQKRRQMLLDLLGPEGAKQRLREDRQRHQQFLAEYRDTQRREQTRETAEMFGDDPAPHELDQEHETE